MDTRQELEERLETVLTDILTEVQACRGEPFDGRLEDAVSFLKEAKDILKQLNNDHYMDEDNEDDEEEDRSGRRMRAKNSDEDDLDWGDDYDDGY